MASSLGLRFIPSHMSHAAKGPHNREDADLCAQMRMADAAEYLTRLTLWQIAVGVLGFGALGFALYYSAKATRAAEDQVRLSREAFINEHRLGYPSSVALLMRVSPFMTKGGGINARN